ncbi:NADH-ubiquinone oxidoreductase 19 kDa subunit [Panicum miliaceum]|uniref:NADH-ubiquinone oxidoreductase 19 kDa subunit n=1 Tax=Panicum miliaceum TaxID=4540 RepID=A0A3L6TPY2_PANMI|nr:NADH-ubiquinone oxidoreductase 19 kDa subunit [Panicum miliaceum]
MSTSSTPVDASGEPIPTSSVLMAASKHIAVRCRPENVAFLNCKKKDPNPDKCLEKGRQVTRCVLSLATSSKRPKHLCRAAAEVREHLICVPAPGLPFKNEPAELHVARAPGGQTASPCAAPRGRVGPAGRALPCSNGRPGSTRGAGASASADRIWAPTVTAAVPARRLADLSTTLVACWETTDGRTAVTSATDPLLAAGMVPPNLQHNSAGSSASSLHSSHFSPSDRHGFISYRVHSTPSMDTDLRTVFSWPLIVGRTAVDEIIWGRHNHSPLSSGNQHTLLEDWDPLISKWMAKDQRGEASDLTRHQG